MVAMEFREHIAKLMESEGVRPLARRLGITERILTMWRTGKVLPTYRNIEKLGGIVIFPERSVSVTSIPGRMGFRRDEFSAILSAEDATSPTDAHQD